MNSLYLIISYILHDTGRRAMLRFDITKYKFVINVKIMFQILTVKFIFIFILTWLHIK